MKLKGHDITKTAHIRTTIVLFSVRRRKVCDARTKTDDLDVHTRHPQPGLLRVSYISKKNDSLFDTLVTLLLLKGKGRDQEDFGSCLNLDIAPF